MASHRQLPVQFPALSVSSPFWSPRIRATVAKDGTLDQMYTQMKTTGRWDCMRYTWKHGDPNEPHIFWDSDVGKWLEAACYALHNAAVSPSSSSVDDDEHHLAEVRKLVDEAVDIVKEGQGKDRYINTYYNVVKPGERWTDLCHNHELYDAGHLLEGAVAHDALVSLSPSASPSATSLLPTLVKYVSLISSIFGPLPGQKKGYPGHQEIELALVRAAEMIRKKEGAEGEEKAKKLVELARFFILERGSEGKNGEGHYYDKEARERGVDPEKWYPHYWPGPRSYWYQQAEAPIWDIKEVNGHSVRATYWLSGVVDVARETGDERLFNKAQELFDDMVDTKMYITGGLGSVRQWEGFGPSYDLPNSSGYLETCASIGLIFLCHRLVRSTAFASLSSRYYDILERALYNAVLVGISLDGRAFFYENPLETVGKVYRRSEWFDVSCCPPNVARLLNSLGQYVYTTSRNDRTGRPELAVHLYLGSTCKVELAGGQTVVVEQETDWPWDGAVRISFDADGREWPEGLEVDVKVRVPGWATSWTASLNDTPLPNASLLGGYLVFTLTSASSIRLDIPLAPRLTRSHALVSSNAGLLAVERGPLVYALESVDNVPARISDLRQVRLEGAGGGRGPRAEAFEEVRASEWGAAFPTGLDPVLLKAKVPVAKTAARGAFWPAEEGRAEVEETEVVFVPYFSWANRGPSEVRVWN